MIMISTSRNCIQLKWSENVMRISSMRLWYFIHIHFIIIWSKQQLNFVLNHSISAIFKKFTFFLAVVHVCARSPSLLPIFGSMLEYVLCIRLHRVTNFVQKKIFVPSNYVWFVFCVCSPFVSNLRGNSNAKFYTTLPPPNSFKLLAAT